jgi:glycosyltransferase EpsF
MHSSKKTVFEYFGALNLGGAETLMMNVFRELQLTSQMENFRFIVSEKISGETYYSEEFLELTEQHGGKIEKFLLPTPTSALSSLKLLLKIPGHYFALKKYFKQNKVDVVHAHMHYFSGVPLMAAKKAGVPIRIFHSHNVADWTDSGVTNKFFGRLIRQSATKIIAVSQEAASAVLGESQSVKDRTEVLINGVDLKKFTSDPTVQEKNDSLQLVQVGRFEPVKNHHFSLLVAQQLKKSGVDFKLTFLGDGVLRSGIEEQITQLELGEYVELLGNVPNVSDYLMKSNFFLMPSHFEGLPLSVVEAQAADLWTLVSPAIPELADVGVGLMKTIDVGSIYLNGTSDGTGKGQFRSVDEEQHAMAWADMILDLAEQQRPDIKEVHKAVRDKSMDMSSYTNRIVQLYTAPSWVMEFANTHSASH